MAKKVFVAMSGGVDSSAVAYLLLKEGYEVCGITMQLIPGEASVMNDAREVAKLLGIPHYLCDLEDIFQEEVLDYFCQEYLAGRTPNPCIVCNRAIKFGALWKSARALGADYLATGHYVRVNYDDLLRRWVLRKGLDSGKDQSYVLYNLTQDILPYLKFPLGGYQKEDVRKVIEDAGLPIAGKKESQEICFIPDDDYRGFLKRNVPQMTRSGVIHDVEGKPVGEHPGVANFTIGQRRGLGLSLGYPAYVLEIDPVKNILVVGKKEDLIAKGLIAKDLNWIALKSLDKPSQARVKIRYSSTPAEAILIPQRDGDVKVEFSHPQKAVTPGQSAVFYNEDLVLGGGVIHKAIR